MSGEYVSVVYVSSQEEADAFRELLADHDIEALVGVDELEETLGEVELESEEEEGIPIFVPAEYLEEAESVIEDFEDQDEFEDLEDEDSVEADDEMDDEEFGMGPEDTELLEEGEDEVIGAGLAAELLGDDDDDEFSFVDDDEFEDLEFDGFDDDDDF